MSGRLRLVLVAAAAASTSAAASRALADEAPLGLARVGDEVVVTARDARASGVPRGRGDRVEIDLAGAVTPAALPVDDEMVSRIELIAGSRPRLSVKLHHGRRTTLVAAEVARVDAAGATLRLVFPRDLYHGARAAAPLPGEAAPVASAAPPLARDGTLAGSAAAPLPRTAPPLATVAPAVARAGERPATDDAPLPHAATALASAEPTTPAPRVGEGAPRSGANAPEHPSTNPGVGGRSAVTSVAAARPDTGGASAAAAGVGAPPIAADSADATPAHAAVVGRSTAPRTGALGGDVLAAAAAPLGSANGEHEVPVIGAAEEGSRGKLVIVVAVLAICGVLALVARRRQSATAKTSLLRVLATQSLGGKSKLVLLGAGGNQMLISVGEKGPQLLGRWREDELPVDGDAGPFEAESPAFDLASPPGAIGPVESPARAGDDAHDDLPAAAPLTDDDGPFARALRARAAVSPVGRRDDAARALHQPSVALPDDATAPAVPRGAMETRGTTDPRAPSAPVAARRPGATHDVPRMLRGPCAPVGAAPVGASATGVPAPVGTRTAAVASPRAPSRSAAAAQAFAATPLEPARSPSASPAVAGLLRLRSAPPTSRCDSDAAAASPAPRRATDEARSHFTSADGVGGPPASRFGRDADTASRASRFSFDGDPAGSPFGALDTTAVDEAAAIAAAVAPDRAASSAAADADDDWTRELLSAAARRSCS